MLTPGQIGPRLTLRSIAHPSSFWNTPLPDDVAVDANLTTKVRADLVRQAKLVNPYVNTTAYSADVTVVPADQPRVPVRLLQASGKPLTGEYWKALAAVLAAGVPIPDDLPAFANDDTDKEACLWQPATDTLWELWRLSRDAQGWRCRWGGRMSMVSQNPGYWVNRYTSYKDRTYPNLPADPAKAALFEEKGWGATATSLPLACGTLTGEDFALGTIPHALGISTINPAKGTLWPAQRNDGLQSTVSPVVEGMRLRLPPGFVIPSSLHPVARMIAAAARDYGLVVWDKAGAISFRAERIIGSRFGVAPYKVLVGFPWDQLQVLAVGSPSQPNVRAA